MRSISMRGLYPFVLVLAGLLVCVSGASAQDHVVSPTDLQKARAADTQKREINQEKVEKFFTSDEAKKALKSAGIKEKKVLEAVGQLTDEELERLATRTDKIQSDFAAGALTNQEITYILIALATPVIIIVIVVA